LGNSVPTSAPVRIAFCITELDPGGAERALVQLVTRLDRARWEPRVFCLAGHGRLIGELDNAGISTVCLEARGRFDLGALWRLWRALRKFRPEILQTFLHHANLAGRIAGRLAGTKHVVSGIRVAERRSRWPLRLDRATNFLVSVNICVSQAVADFSRVSGGLDAKKLEVIPNGVDVDSFANAEPLDLTVLGLPAGIRPIVAVGRLEPQKGIDVLLEAAAEMVGRRPDLDFLIVGEGPSRRSLEERAHALGLASHVHFAGWRADVPRILRSSAVLALASRWEGMPNVVLEAMAAGLTVVATRVEGVEEVVTPETGILVPPASAASLARGLETLLAAPQRAEAMGQAGQKHVQALFSWENAVNSYTALYDRLLSARRPAG
jgi:glycosyltransferase involved in cell wall biosynthesis